MNCNKCGSIIEQGDLFCKGCGAETEFSKEIKEKKAQAEALLNNHNFINEASNQFSQNLKVNTPSNVMAEEDNDINYDRKLFTPMTLGSVIVLVFIIGIIFAFKIEKKPEPIVEDPVIEGYKINYENYDMVIPKEYSYKIGTDSIFIFDENNEWTIEFKFIEYNYQDIITNQSTLKNLIKDKKVSVSDFSEKNISNKSFMTSEVTIEGSSFIAAFTALDETKVIALYAYNQSNTIDYTLLEKYATVVKFLKYNDLIKELIIKDYDLGIITKLIPESVTK